MVGIVVVLEISGIVCFHEEEEEEEEEEEGGEVG
jgi:hypothetical protein